MKKDRTCQYCNETFLNVEGRVHSNHVRWCKKNPNDTTSNLKGARAGDIKRRYGELNEFIVICAHCKCETTIVEYAHGFPKKDKYFCSRKCSNSGRQFTEDGLTRLKEKCRAQSIKLWKTDEYQQKMSNVISASTRFTSKAEVYIREHFINKFTDDKWTFGGVIRYNDLGIVRDLFSKKLKVCFEYDGVWHFKDIHGQLEKKQAKDKALEVWCIENSWRLIRMSESFHLEHKDDFVYIIEDAIYNKQDQIIKFGDEYLHKE